MGNCQLLICNCSRPFDSAHYGRHHLQKISWGLKTPPRVFLEEHLNEENDRLRHTFELFER